MNTDWPPSGALPLLGLEPRCGGASLCLGVGASLKPVSPAAGALEREPSTRSPPEAAPSPVSESRFSALTGVAGDWGDEEALSPRTHSPFHDALSSLQVILLSVSVGGREWALRAYLA